MKNSTLTVIFAVIALFVFSSCKVGHAINDFNDCCPIYLADGIQITKAESKGSSTKVEVVVAVNSLYWDVSGLTPSQKSEFEAAIIELARENENYRVFRNKVTDSGAKITMRFSYN